MRPGELVDERFELLDVAGSGGMGTVYRAIDRSTGGPVAFKVLRTASVDGAQRFARETRVLAGLRAFEELIAIETSAQPVVIVLEDLHWGPAEHEAARRCAARASRAAAVRARDRAARGPRAVSAPVGGARRPAHLSRGAEQGDGRLEAASRAYLANIVGAQGNLVEAESLLRRALQTVQAASRPSLLADLASVLLRQGRAGEALIAAREGHDLLDSLGGVEEGESQVRLMLAEALHATGDRDAARTAIARARDRLLERANKIVDARLRAMFLEALPENARTTVLAKALLGSR